MSEEQLTVEKVRSSKWKKDEDGDLLFYIGNDWYLAEEIKEYLLSQLATIERDTAEKCAKISENIVGNGCDFIEDVIAEGIRDHFNHKEG